jgi:hypothetical protein
MFIATHMFPSCFRRMLQVFQLFRTYVANVSSRCCKSRFGITHVAVGNHVSADQDGAGFGHGAVRNTKTWSGAGSHVKQASGRYPSPDIHALAFP